MPAIIWLLFLTVLLLPLMTSPDAWMGHPGVRGRRCWVRQPVDTGWYD